MPARPNLPLHRQALVAAVFACLAAGAHAESATVLKKTEVRATPAAAADVVAELKAKETVEIAARQGAWANVKTSSGVDGWTRILNLSTSSPSGARGSGSADLGALFATGSNGATSTTAAKGLSPNDLMQASPDATQLAKLDGYASNAGDAGSFAAQAPVTAQKIPYLASNRRGSR